MEKIKQIAFPIIGIPEPNKKIFFVQDPEITSAILLGISIPKVGTDISASFKLNGAELLPDADLNRFFITLCDYKGNELHKNLVPYTLQPANNNGKIKKMFYNNIDLKKSYLTVNRQLSGNSKIILFNFHIKTPDLR